MNSTLKESFSGNSKRISYFITIIGIVIILLGLRANYTNSYFHKIEKVSGIKRLDTKVNGTTAGDRREFTYDDIDANSKIRGTIDSTISYSGIFKYHLLTKDKIGMSVIIIKSLGKSRLYEIPDKKFNMFSAFPARFNPYKQ